MGRERERDRITLENEEEEQSVGGERRMRKSDGENRKEARGEREKERKGKREVLYVTVVRAVRCGRSRRCLLIYWRDSFRRRAAFPKWWPRARHGYPFNAPAATSRQELPFHLRTRKEGERERASSRRPTARRDGRTLANFHF